MLGRVPATARARPRRRPDALTEAYHDFGQSVSVFDLLGERYQAGLSYLELGKLAGAAGARSRATRYLTDAIAVFESLGAQPDLAETRAALAQRAGRQPPAGSSACRWTATTRWCDGLWTPL